jgi:hypothetical protein
MSNYQLGPCNIEYPAGTDLGKTHGGVTITVEETFVPLNTDQDGENPVDEYLTGTMVTVEGSLAEITIENLAKLFKQTVVTDGTKKKVSISPNVGTSLLAESSVMIIKPYDGGSVSANANDFITLMHAGMRANTSLTYNATDQRTIGFTATGFPDTSTGIIAVFGDTSAT